MPSKATLSSTNSMPAAAQAAASSSLIGREASEMSVSPAQKSANPSPVPGPSTVAAMPEPQSRSRSPTRAEMGSTVEEPETTTSPSTSVGQELSLPPELSGDDVESLPPQALASRPTARSKDSQANGFLVNKGCPPWGSNGVPAGGTSWC